MDAKQYNSDEIEIDLGEILAILMDRIVFIMLFAMISGAIAFLISKFLVVEQYESKTSVYILSRQNSETLTYTDVQLGSQLTVDYSQLIKSRHVLENVLATSGIEMSVGELAGKIDVDTASNTRILTITVTDEIPARAQYLADEVRKEAAQRIKDVMDIQAVNVVDEANFPTSPASPNVLKWTLIGFLIGAFCYIALVIVRFMLDDTIKTSDDVEKYLGMSTLGMIPLREDPESARKSRRHKKAKEGVTEKSGQRQRKSENSDTEEDIVEIG